MTKTDKIIMVVRIILSIVLCVLIYTETGIFTTIFAATMVIYTELNSHNVREQYKFNKEIQKIKDFMNRDIETKCQD